MQVLISIAGQVPVDELDAPLSTESVIPQLGPAISAASSRNAGAAPASLASDEPMQSDQAQQATRLVSHTLAIKRKKICTQHPVQVPVQPRPATQTPAYEATVRPPTQPILAPAAASGPAAIAASVPTAQSADLPQQQQPVASHNRNRWTHEQQQQQQVSRLDRIKLETK